MRTLFVILLLIGLVGGAYYLRYGLPQQELAKAIVGGRAFYVEIADNDAKRARGLSGRDEIGSDGMLFVFDEPAPQCFWMKDTRFPLDLIFISEGRVLAAETMDALSECTDCYCPPAGIKITYALELPAFSRDRYTIRPGDQVRIFLPGQYRW